MFQLTANERKVLIGIAVVIFAGAGIKYFKAATARSVYADSPKITRLPSDKLSVAAPPAGNVTAGILKKQKSRGESKTLFPINVNTASQEELERIPGIGPIIARRIIECRSTRANFYTLDDLAVVEGIGRKKLEKIRDYISL
jgi:comEA protein